MSIFNGLNLAPCVPGLPGYHSAKTYAAWPVWSDSTTKEIKLQPMPKRQRRGFGCEIASNDDLKSAWRRPLILLVNVAAKGTRLDAKTDPRPSTFPQLDQ